MKFNLSDILNAILRPSCAGARDDARKITVRLSENHKHEIGLSPDLEYTAWKTPKGTLLRPVDPPLTKIYLEPTTICNLKCRTCMRNSWSEPYGEMSMETYRRLLQGLKPIRSLQTIAFWGFGEPLTHPHIVEMIGEAKKLGVKTELITNGILLSREMAEALVMSGLDTLVVSLDGTSPESLSDIREGADLREVQANIGFLNSVKKARASATPEVGIEFVAMRRNIAELKNLVPMARSMEAAFVIVTNLLPYTEELKDEILYWMSAGDFYPSTRSRWRPEILLPRFDARPENMQHLKELSSYVVAGGYRPRLNGGLDGYCPFVWEGSAAVSRDGSVSPCVALMHSYSCYILDRHKSIRKYVLGNVNGQSFEKIWNSGEYAGFRRKVRKFDFAPCVSCGGCDMADTNEEDCFNGTFPTCGDCLWARGILLCP